MLLIEEVKSNNSLKLAVKYKKIIFFLILLKEIFIS
jgi:hypothetical protein